MRRVSPRTPTPSSRTKGLLKADSKAGNDIRSKSNTLARETPSLEKEKSIGDEASEVRTELERIRVTRDEDGMRLDRFLRVKYRVPQSLIEKSLRSHLVPFLIHLFHSFG